MVEQNFSTIDRPYDPNLDRTPGNTNNGNLETQPVKAAGSLGDVWITNFIRSDSWLPRSFGFYLNGQTGYAEFTNVYVSGDIQALTGTIGGFTINATNLSVTSGGNTVTVSSSTNAFIAGPTGSPTVTISQAGLLTVSNIAITGGTLNIGSGNAVIDSSGYATFIGVFTVNMKAYTTFEGSSRFDTPVVVNSGAVTFSNSGVLVDTGATLGSSAALRWFLSQNMFGGSPSFSLCMEMQSAAAATGSSFFGIGEPTVAGTGHTYTVDHIGFKILKTAGAVTLYGTQATGGVELATSALTTVTTGDVIDLIFKVNGTSSVDYYWRKNTGAMSAKTTLTGTVPTATINHIQFSMSNDSTAVRFYLYLISASLER